MPLEIGIRNPNFFDKEFRIQHLESGIHGVESRIQDCLAKIRLFEAVNGNAPRPFTFHCKLYIMDFRISNILRILCFTAVCGLMHLFFTDIMLSNLPWKASAISKLSFSFSRFSHFPSLLIFQVIFGSGLEVKK